MPCFGISQPHPPPSVSPATPVVADDAAGRGEAVVLRFAIELLPEHAAFDAGGLCGGIDANAFICERSIIAPASQMARPLTLWPPPRTATSSPSSCASASASATSALPRHCAMNAGSLVDVTVVNAPRVVVRGIRRLEQTARECRPEFGDGSSERHGRHFPCDDCDVLIQRCTFSRSTQSGSVPSSSTDVVERADVEARAEGLLGLAAELADLEVADHVRRRLRRHRDVAIDLGRRVRRRLGRVRHQVVDRPLPRPAEHVHAGVDDEPRGAQRFVREQAEPIDVRRKQPHLVGQPL